MDSPRNVENPFHIDVARNITEFQHSLSHQQPPLDCILSQLIPIHIISFLFQEENGTNMENVVKKRNGTEEMEKCKKKIYRK
jgi:vacuolar-type H+-ATPase subunit C/Vma6